MALRKIKTLSGGQKSRVALAIVTYRQCPGLGRASKGVLRPHLIYLDEVGPRHARGRQFHTQRAILWVGP